MFQGIATVVFFLLVWLVGTFVQYLYWKRVRKLIREKAKDHVGYMGTGMCKISFGRQAFVLVFTDARGTITSVSELKGLSLIPEFSEIGSMTGLGTDEALKQLPKESYRDAFLQAFHVIHKSMVSEA